MSRGLTDVPMIVVGNKTDLLRRDLASDKFRHDVINKVRVRIKIYSSCFDVLRGKGKF